MKQITQNYKSGAIRLEDVAPPALKDGGVLVRTWFSVVSPGTEGMKVREGKLSFIGKARARPDQLKKVIATLRQQGLAATYQKVMTKLDSLSPLGYSLAGEVIAVGKDAEEFRVGQRVACAGANYANHAEMNFVPKNLVVPVPDGVEMRHAAFATLGAIALHGCRQAEMQLGETACVIGLGLLGQLLVQILRVGGMRVVGVDIVEARCRLAEQNGAALALTPTDPGLLSAVKRITRARGVDRVFICAGGSSNAPVELAARLARDRGRVVDIGKTRLDLPWNDYYVKELDVRFARSYGPGRYDPVFEERGVDYPIGYVRWTERRNLEAFLDLLADGKVQIEPLISAMFPFNAAEQIYRQLAEGKDGAIGIVFSYGAEGAAATPAPPRVVAHAPRRGKHQGRIGVGVIGAGSYASSMLLPHLQRNSKVDLIGVATTSSLSAENAKQRFGFERATTDHTELLADPAVDAVVIATRHASHARLVIGALEAGKAVYVEKPLALSRDELQRIRQSVLQTGNDRLMVGFNRRFAPMIATMAQRFSNAAVPVVVHYRVHAGQLEQGSWYNDPAEGLRFIGEAGHFIDVMSYLTDSRPLAVLATALKPQRLHRDDLDNVVAIVEYENGSVGNLAYTTQGGTKIPKEHLEIFGGGSAAQLWNFEKLVLFEGDEARSMRASRLDKGQSSQLQQFIDAVGQDTSMPIALDCLFDTTAVVLAIAESWQRGERVSVAARDVPPAPREAPPPAAPQNAAGRSTVALHASDAGAAAVLAARSE